MKYFCLFTLLVFTKMSLFAQSSDYWIAETTFTNEDPYYIDFKNNKFLRFDRKDCRYSLEVFKSRNQWRTFKCEKYNASKDPNICAMAGRCDTTFTPINEAETTFKTKKQSYKKAYYDDYLEDLQLIEANLAGKNTTKEVKIAFDRLFKNIPFVGMNEAEARKALWFINKNVKLGKNNGFYLWLFEYTTPKNTKEEYKFLFKGKVIVKVAVK